MHYVFCCMYSAVCILLYVDVSLARRQQYTYLHPFLASCYNTIATIHLFTPFSC